MRKARVLLLDTETGKVIDSVDVLSAANVITCNDGETIQQKLDAGKLQGEQGKEGKPGAKGETPNISIGSVTTIETGEMAYITKTGTPENVILNFFIPQGKKGDSFINSGEIEDKINSNYIQCSVGLYKHIPALQLDFEINYTFDKNVVLTGLVYAQSAYKSIDSWSMYVNDKLLFENISTKEVGQNKTFDYFCSVNAWQTVKIIHHNNSGNSKEIWIDINYYEIINQN